MKRTTKFTRRFGILSLALAAAFALQTGPAWAAPGNVVTANLSLYYRADNVDGNGNPGNGTTTLLKNLINPGTYDGTIVNGSGVANNGAVAAPYEYGVVLSGASFTHITSAFLVGITPGTPTGVNKATATTWEFWLRDTGVANDGKGGLYSEVPGTTTNRYRHSITLRGTSSTTRYAEFNSHGPTGGTAMSGSPLFEMNTFAQIVVTKNGDTLTFYKNGTQVGTTAASSESYDTQTPTRTLLGMRGVNVDPFTGQFNIVRVYDGVLTAEQVLQNYNAETAPPDPVTTVDHFVVAGIASPQTAGTAITGVTITAQNADNTTTTDFTGKVVFSGTAGITGTSAAFIAGELTGVSVTPITAGSGRTFIVTGSTKTGSATFDVNPGAVSETNSTATASPATGVSTDGGATSTITVTAKDANNNLIAGAEVSAGSDGTGNTLSTPANTNVSGQTTFTIASTKAETKTLTVTIAGTSITEQPTVEFVAGTATAIALTWGDNQIGDVATALASPFVVTVTDANENPVAGQSVTFAVATSPSGATGQSLSITNATTDAYGQGTSTLTLGSVPGSYTVAATAGSLTGSPVTFTATATLPAGSFVKAATGTDLIAGASWTGNVAPTSTDVAYWISSSLDTGLTLGTSSAWAGINVAGAQTDIGITGAGTLTLGSSGIDMSVAGVNLSMGNPIALDATQTWNVNAARTLTLSGSLSSATTGTKTLTVNGAGNTQIGGNISNGTEGTLALTKSGAGTLTLSGTSNTYTDLTTVSGGTLVVAHQNALQNSTLSYSAGTLQLGNSTNNVTAVTLGGLSGSSNIALTNAYSTPASVALTVGNNSASTTYDGVLSDGTVAGGSLTKTGTGTLTLSKAQTYTGPTTITGGTLKIGVTSTVGSQTYNTIGTGTWTAPTGITSVNYLVVGGGGGGGANNGGGGGGGQVLQGTMSVTSGTGYSYSIGAGGAGRSGNTLEGFNGSPSSFGNAGNIITAYGGGGGGCNAKAGIGTSSLGSAGGGGNASNGGIATVGQGYNGGNGYTGNPYNGGGGGGAGGAGFNGTATGGGNGGIGVQCAANGLWYGAGGGGDYSSGKNPGIGGSGVGGNGGGDQLGGNYFAPTSGSNGSGGGGSGFTYAGGAGASGAGGPGAVVLSWGSSLPATLPSATALSIADGSTLDLNGTAQTVASLSVAGTGVGGLGAVINSSATPATLTLTSGITLSANSSMVGTGTGAGNLTIALGSGQPISLTYDGSTPALSISQGTLSLSNNPFTINGSVLADGNYNIVTATAITDGSTTYPTPTGTALTGKTASITVSGVNVVLTVSGGGDVTQPEWVSGWPKADTATSNGFTVRAKANEAGNAYYVVVAGGADAPTAAQVKAGYDSTGSSALRSGTLALTVDTENSAAVTGLSPGTPYDVWFVAEDGVPNLQAAPSKVIVTVNPGAVSAANSTATASPATGVSTDGGATSTITVTAKDANNNVIAGATVSASSSGTGNTLSTPANTNGSGQTTFTIASTKAETKTLTVTIAGTPITAQPSVEFVAGTAATIALTSGNNQNGTVATALASPCVVTVTDANGNPISGTGVTFAVATTPSDATGQSLSTTSATTDGSGQAWSTLTLGTKSGNYTVTATAGSLTGSPVTFTVTGNSAAANKVRVESAADGTGTVVATRDVTAGSPHTVYAITRDTYDNFVANPSATWSLEGFSDGVVGGDLVAGGASAEFTGHMVGSANIQAVVSSFTGQSGLQTVTPAAANKLVFTTNPDGATVGSAFGTQPVVKTQDTYGNLSSVGLGASLPVILAVKTGTGTLLGTTPYDIGTSAGNGTITGSGLHIDQAGDFTLSATADGLTEGDSASFTVQSLYQAWLATNGNATASDANFLTFAFGASVPGGASGSAGYVAGPPAVVTPGQPTTTLTSGNPVVCRAVFSRRSDYVTAGLSYTLQFSADLNFGDGFREDMLITVPNGDTIKLLGTGIVNGVSVDVMSVSYPLQIMVGGVPKKPTFYRVKVNTTGS